MAPCTRAFSLSSESISTEAFAKPAVVFLSAGSTLVTPEQAAAYVHAQSVAATATIESMKADNCMRQHRGEYPAYGEESFLAVIDEYGIHHNAIITIFQGAS
jgi:hypothetical protein